MAEVIFYEKPGCINNTRQKELMHAAGHIVDARNLLEKAWQIDSLRPYFGSLPVAQWFNRTAPMIKSGEVNPDTLSEQEALALMLETPLLIRRPLMQVNGECRVGFKIEEVDAWIGLKEVDENIDVETCTRKTSTPCEVTKT